MPAKDLQDHLESFGFCHFDVDEDYWSWGGGVLGPNLSQELDRLRKPLSRGRASAHQLKTFYDFIADPRIAPVVHSMKSGAILISGWFANEHILDGLPVLDIGCCTGYLTTFYARRFPKCQVVGWDFSPRSVAQAREEARKRGIGNVDFDCKDIARDVPCQAFGTIISTQALGSMRQRARALASATGALEMQGHLVCVEALGTPEETRSFLDDAHAAGLRLQGFEFLAFSDLGCPHAYPAFLFSRQGEAIDVDLHAEYVKVMNELYEDEDLLYQ